AANTHESAETSLTARSAFRTLRPIAARRASPPERGRCFHPQTEHRFRGRAASSGGGGVSVSARERSGESTARSRAKVMTAVAPLEPDDDDVAAEAIEPARGGEPPALDLRTLKAKSIADLAALARDRSIDGAATLRKQEL